MARNPNWTRDEVILALDLYIREGRQQLDAQHPEVIALSQLLNRLPFHAPEHRTTGFRNPAGVSMKLGNFLAVDPAYAGAGLSRGSKLEQEIWDEFASDLRRLQREAQAIRTGGAQGMGPIQALSVEDAWPAVRRAATSALEREDVLLSPVQGRRYEVVGVDEKGFDIRRDETGSTERVTRALVEQAVGFINAAGGRVGRRTLHYTVAKEEAIVQLHPNLAWDASKEWIEVRPVGVEVDGPRRYWALLANPARYRIEEAVRVLQEETWTTKGKAIAPGDGVIIWKAAGRDGRRGVVAFGTVEGVPEAMAHASPYWVDPDEGERIEERVPIRYEVPEGLPLWMKAAPKVLGRLAVARARGGTVFSVSEAEWEAVRAAVDEEPSDVAPSSVPALSEVMPEVVDQPLLRTRPPRPTGRAGTSPSSGSPARRSKNAKVVGDRAEAVVVEHLRRTLPPEQGKTVRWVAVEGERPGWDVEYVGSDGEVVAVEVKGTTGARFEAVEVTANEWVAAEAKGAYYHLYLVARCMGERPQIQVVRDPWGRMRDGEFAATPSVWRLEAVVGRGSDPSWDAAAVVTWYRRVTIPGLFVSTVRHLFSLPCPPSSRS